MRSVGTTLSIARCRSRSRDLDRRETKRRDTKCEVQFTLVRNRFLTEPCAPDRKIKARIRPPDAIVVHEVAPEIVGWIANHTIAEQRAPDS